MCFIRYQVFSSSSPRSLHLLRGAHPLPPKVEIWFPSYQRVASLHECEMTAREVTLAKILTNQLIRGRLSIYQVGQVGDAKFRLLKKVTVCRCS